MAERPRVSVVVPIFNAERYLAEAIESVLAQSFQDWELVLVNDGSTDSSGVLAGAYAARAPERIRLLAHPNGDNRGVCASRNLGVRDARAEAIALLDADDVWLPHKLEAQMAILERHPDVGMVYGHSRYWRSWQGHGQGPEADHTPPVGVAADRVYTPPALALELYPLGRHGAPCPSNLLLRRDLVLKIGGFEEQFHRERQLYEDQAFLAKVYLHAPVYVSSEVWHLYRIHPGSCDSTVIESGRYHEVRRYFLEWLEGYYQRTGVTDPALLALLRRALDESPQRQTTPATGEVQFGSLRRTLPISSRFGYDRGTPIDRYYIEGFLARHRLAIGGRTLEIGDDAYTRRFGGDRVTERDVLNVAPTGGTTIVADLANADQIPSDTFDCVILTQTLQFLYDVPAGVRTLYRILKPGGILLATFPGLTQIVDVWFGGNWYWGFTRASAGRLFSEEFGRDQVDVRSHGNVLSTISFLHGLAAEELERGELDALDPRYQLLISVRATKPLVAPPEPTRVSVVIPCHNHAAFLSEAIESVLAQDYPNLEVIVVDDGSTDGSGEVAVRYGVQVIRQENRGLAAARNAGRRASTGAFLLFLDADDRLVAGGIAASARVLAEHRECGMVFGRFHVMNPRGVVQHPAGKAQMSGSHYETLLHRNFIIMHGTAMFRREVFDRIGEYDEALEAAEDYDLYLRVAREFPILGHGAFVADVRKGHASMTRNAGRMLQFTLTALRRQLPLIGHDPQLRKAYDEGVAFWRDWYGSRIVQAARIARVEGQQTAFEEACRTLERDDPERLAAALAVPRKSNELAFVVGDDAGVEPSAGTGQGLVLRRLGVRSTRPGEGFNIQPDGESALWVECEQATERTTVVFDGVPLPTQFGSPALLTATVPPVLYANAGRYRVYLID